MIGIEISYDESELYVCFQLALKAGWFDPVTQPRGITLSSSIATNRFNVLRSRNTIASTSWGDDTLKGSDMRNML